MTDIKLEQSGTEEVTDKKIKKEKAKKIKPEKVKKVKQEKVRKEKPEKVKKEKIKAASAKPEKIKKEKVKKEKAGKVKEVKNGGFKALMDKLPKGNKGGKTKLAIKIMIPLLAVLLSFIFTEVITLVNVTNTSESLDHLKNKNIKAYGIAKDLSYGILETVDFFTEVALSGGIGDANGGEVIKVRVEELFDELVETWPSDEAYYRNVAQSYDNYYEMCLKMCNEYILAGKKAGNTMKIQVDPYKDGLLEKINHIADAMDASMEEAMEETEGRIAQIKLVLMLTAVTIIVLLAITLLIVFGVILRPLKVITGAVNTLAERDLTMEELKVKSRDEMGQLTESFNKLLVSTRDVMNGIQISSGEVEKTSDSVKRNADTIQTNMASIADAVAYIAQGANDQAVEIERTTNEIEKLNSIIETNEKVTINLSNACEKISTASNEGTDIINGLYDVTMESEVAFKDIFTSITSIKESAEKIKKASDMIESISSQTNLLSLNASIEAARAGEHGRGFAVVAGEIRSLSDDTNNCVLEINKMIQNLQENIVLAGTKSDSIKATVEKQVKSVEETKSKYTEITGSVANISEEIVSLGSVSEALTGSVQNVTEIMHAVAAAAEESSASTEETNASVEEVLAMVEEIVEETNDIGAVSDQLKEQVAMYKM